MIAMHSRYLWAAAVVVALAQIAVLGSMIWGRAAILRSGREVTLQVEPVDPRDLLRGDYVIVNYNVSRFPQALVTGPKKDANSSFHTIFVRLKPAADGIWQPVSANFDVPAPGAAPDEVDIRGVVDWIPPQDSDLGVTYGIERFYLPEGEGLAIEEGIGVRPFRMKVAVASDGAPQIKAFYDGDKMIYAEPLY